MNCGTVTDWTGSACQTNARRKEASKPMINWSGHVFDESPLVRVAQSDTLREPFLWSGSIISVFGAKPHMGTGMMLSPRAVLTAAHNINDKGIGTATSATFIPARNGDYQPYPIVTVADWYIPHPWLAFHKTEDDYAVLRLQDARVIPSFPRLHVGTDKELDGQTFQIAQYPNDAGEMYFAQGKVMTLPGTDLLLDQISTKPGASGAGLTASGEGVQPWIVGIHSGRGAGGFNQAVRVTQKVEVFILQWAKFCDLIGASKDVRSP